MVTIAQRFASGLRSLSSSTSLQLSRFFRHAGAARSAGPRSGSVKPLEPKDERVESRRKSAGMAQQTLRSSLKAGRITQEEYAARVAQLSETQSG